MKKLSFIYKNALLCLMILMMCMLTACTDARTQLITSSADLLREITKADAGAQILVGDIDFTPQPGVSNEFARITLQKNITIKSGYEDRDAVFSNACFNIVGNKTSGTVLECIFKDIVFDGGVSPDSITAEDWEIPLKDDGTPRLNEPVKAQYAIGFGGNVSAGFEGCVFRNYMYETGPVIRAYYGDYTGNPGLADLFDDYSGCRLSVILSGCEISDNSAMCGGSIYLDGNNNIDLIAENCVFSDNISGCGEFSEGGGVCRLSDMDAVFADCSFSGNEGNHCYCEHLDELIAEYKAQYAEFDGSDRTDYYYLADTDRTRGGAVYSQNGSLVIENCDFSNNRASLGGALDLLNTNTQINNSVFTGNSASPVALDPYDETGPWSAMGMGGAIYIESNPTAPVYIFASDIIGNSAKNAYGSIYGFWSDEYKALRPLGLGSIDLYNCTVKDNICIEKYDYQTDMIIPWVSHPGDILEIEYLKMHGCVFADEVFENDFPRSELPSSENDFNYVVSSEKDTAGFKNASEISIPENVQSLWNKNMKDVHRNDPKQNSNSFSLIILSVVIIAAVMIVVLMMRARKEKKDTEQQAASGPVGTEDLFSDQEIADLRENILLRQLLTEREIDVMCEYISGSSRRRLAQKLMISESTAKTHISSIYSKMEVSSKKELVKKLKNL